MLGKGDYVQAQFTYSKGAISVRRLGHRTVASLRRTTDGTVNYSGPAFDAVVTTAAGNLDLTKAWSITGGFEHFWTPSGRPRCTARTASELQRCR